MTKKSRPQNYSQPINHSPSQPTFLLFTIPMPLLKPRLPISSLLRPHSHQSSFRYISMTKTKMASAPAVATGKQQINLLSYPPPPKSRSRTRISLFPACSTVQIRGISLYAKKSRDGWGGFTAGPRPRRPIWRKIQKEFVSREVRARILLVCCRSSVIR